MAQVKNQQLKESAKIISFINMKGGVGKTTLTVNIADKLVEKGLKVLVIDMDPQFNSTQTLLLHKVMLDKQSTSSNPQPLVITKSGSTTVLEIEDELKLKEIENEIEEEETSTQIYDKIVEQDGTVLQLFVSTSIVSQSKVILSIKPGLDIIPGDLTLAKEISGDTSNKVEVIMDFIEKNELKNDYHYIFIDCPPTWSILTHSSLFASDYYVIPSKVDLYSSIGIKLLEQQISDKITSTTTYKKMGLDLKNLGIVFSLVHRKIKAEELRIEKIKGAFKNINFFESFLPHMPSVPSKFTVYSDAKYDEKYIQLINSIEKITVELIDKTTTEKGD
ncbi:ParA family protein [Lysinibacillus pakistanensis]|uniref:AAA family ATPase n=1 Tax=Lysinibacillus pakistanensis TaxID=759811 RepID=A0ABX6DEJ5_9BACI|nr:AAA family ATPase [Lysinibacillus pakistanensis]